MAEKAVIYYLIRERLMGKKDVDGYYLFVNGEWVTDEKNVIRDHLMGFDPNEPSDSPYAFGSMSIMDEIDEIPSDIALKLINGKMR